MLSSIILQHEWYYSFLQSCRQPTQIRPMSIWKEGRKDKRFHDVQMSRGEVKICPKTEHTNKT